MTEKFLNFHTVKDNFAISDGPDLSSEDNNTSTWSNLEGEEAVRSVFIRACQIHCEAKALVHMKFAAFEESVGQTEKAKVILDRLIMRYPLMIGKSFHETLCSRNFQNVKLRLHFLRISQSYCNSNFHVKSNFGELKRSKM